MTGGEVRRVIEAVREVVSRNRPKQFAFTESRTRAERGSEAGD
jgi:hypothetical protein